MDARTYETVIELLSDKVNLLQWELENARKKYISETERLETLNAEYRKANEHLKEENARLIGEKAKLIDRLASKG